ncbi:MAG: TonB-dependent receptor [Acidobacteria bacterium]|nr:TonB-dependent receptor [Acidobacteriota bacterium]
MKLFAGLAVCIMFSSAMFGQQVSGSITGVVKDNQQAVITNAKVTLLNTAQGNQREATTSHDGSFVFTPLQPAVYTLTIESQGFKKYEQKEIKLFANDRIALPDIVLSLGTVTETVVVEESAAQLQTKSAERSGVITGSQVVNLALTARNFLDLMKTIPGVAPVGGLGGSVNGNRNNQNNLMVDGVTNVDTGSNGGTLATMNIDMIAEFKVLTNSQPAEFGRSSGAAINVVSKSGTRDLHGTGYLFHRNEGLNANNWLNNQQPDSRGIARQRQLYRYNFAGFNVGGPVLIPGTRFNKDRNKLFFFVGMEWQNQLSPNSLRNVTVPTALQRNGDFSQTREGDGRPVTIVDPLNNKQPFPGNIIPANRINADGQKILGFYPQPNASDNQFNYQTQVSDTFPRRENIYRGDYNINDKWRVYSRFIKTKSQQDRAYGQWSADYNIPFGPMNFGNPGWSFITNVTTIVNPTLTNEFIFGSSKNVLNIDPTNDAFKRSKLGLSYKMPFPSADPIDLVQNWRFGGVPNAPFSGFNGTPFRNFNHTYDITNNVSKIWQSHTFKAGIYLHKSLKDQTAFTAVNGDIWFDRDGANPGDSGWAYSNAILGNFQSLAQSNVALNGQYRDWNVEWFVQDNWRVNSKLTLDVGIRFYWIQPQYDQALQTSSFNPSLYSADAKGVLVQPTATRGVGLNPVTGQTTPGALIGSIVNTGKGFVNGLYANGMGLAGQNGYPAGLIENRGIHYAPRIGIAWTPIAKTVIRTGIGVFYDRFQGNPVFDMLPNPPSTIRPTFYYGALPAISSLQGTFFPAGLRGFDLGGHVPTTYNWNLTVQRELPKRIILDVGYVGSKSVHMLSRSNVNVVPFGSAWLPQNQDPTVANPTRDGRTTKQINLYRPFVGHGNIEITGFGAYANYNSLQIGVNRNLAKGLLFGVAYTWSKTLGIASGDGDVLHPTNFRMANYSLLDYDIPHILTFNYQWEVPKAARSGNFLDNVVGRTILNGWQLSGLTSLLAGQPANIGVSFTGLGGADVNRIYTGSESISPRVALAGNPQGGSKALDAWVDGSVFRAPVVGSQGLESAQRIVRRPGINNWDVSVFKNINSVNFNPANGQVTNLPTSKGGGGGRYGFGAINAVRDPRIIQLAMKFYF